MTLLLVLIFLAILFPVQMTGLFLWIAKLAMTLVVVALAVGFLGLAFILLGL